jgi:hypothetical protein
MSEGPSELFLNAEMLTRRFEGWPSFHDAEVLRLEIVRGEGRVLSMDVYVFGVSGNVDKHGYFIRTNRSVVTLRFRGVNDLNLTDFNEQNVLQDLVCCRQVDGSLRVEIHPTYGLCGSFSCLTAEVAVLREAD